MKRKKWTEEEIKFLKENYKNISNIEIAIQLNRSVKSIENKKRRLKLKYNNFFWKKKEKEFLRQNYDIMTTEEIAKELHKSNKAIQVMKIRLRLLNNRKIYTPDEEKIIIDLYKNRYSIKKIACKLKTTYNSIRYKLVRLRKKGVDLDHLSSRRKYSEDEIRALYYLFPVMETEALAKLLFRTKKSVTNQAWKLRIFKTPKHIKITKSKYFKRWKMY